MLSAWPTNFQVDIQGCSNYRSSQLGRLCSRYSAVSPETLCSSTKALLDYSLLNQERVSKLMIPIFPATCAQLGLFSTTDALTSFNQLFSLLQLIPVIFIVIQCHDYESLKKSLSAI